MSENPSEDTVRRCPHCDSELLSWETPYESSWGGAIRLVCFNDECPYFVRGWELMMERQAVCCSYRHSIDPETGASSPVPVWSKEALKDGIVQPR